ncbi:oxidoreductase [Tricladium varicosporioides]|nr:oxidoreductase [Hymenoscyphus varicosporioides]
MAPTKVGFLGLSTVGWARGAHLPYLQASSDYEIVAVCNSSIESAQHAIKLYELPESTKAYGSPEDLAEDSEVELVVCSVRVDRHLPTIKPSLLAGKDVYVEWPLGKNLAEAKELVKLKNEGGVKSVAVGLQARQAPVVRKVKELVASGKVGEVLSSTWIGAAGSGGATTTEGYEYLGRREVGGNLVTIHFGHSVDYVQYVLGYGFQGQPKTLLANRRKTVKLTNADGKVIEENHPKDSDDTIFLHSTLASGIPLSMALRGGPPIPGTPGLDWRIYGSTGELRITASGPFLQIGYPDIKIEYHDHASNQVTSIPFEDLEENGDLGIPARNVAAVYRRLRERKEGKEVEGICGFEDAVERHALLESMYAENGIKF